MNAQQLHHQSAASAFHKSVKPRCIAPIYLSAKALNDDSCWDEFDSDYEEALPSNVFSFTDDAD